MTHVSLTAGNYGRLRRCLGVVVIAIGVSACAAVSHQSNEPLNNIYLAGGYFYGPGPIVPDTLLPPGKLANVRFDIDRFEGHTEFYNSGSIDARLSDKETEINQNIEAGRLDIGDGKSPVWLVAVNGGAHSGKEVYYLDKNYQMIWRVDLALDPGFEEGIIRMNDFMLTTGVVPVAHSIQSQNNVEGGYDQAGSLMSGQYLNGRVGDFDQDGKLDGIVVASPNVPLESIMLPGAPVGNERGFTTDIDIEPHVACELTLRGLMQFKDPVNNTIKLKNKESLVGLLEEIRDRLSAARKNMERSLLVGAWRKEKLSEDGFQLSGELDTVKSLNFISWATLTGYKSASPNISPNVQDSIARMFQQLEILINRIDNVNEKTGITLPKKAQSHGVTANRLPNHRTMVAV